MTRRRFWSCEEMCPCDDYVALAPTPELQWLSEWTNMVAGSAPAGPHLWCPHCRVTCTEVLEYDAPAPPFDVDGDGWYLRRLRPGEDARALDALVGTDGFVSEDRSTLYLHRIEELRHYA